MVYTYSVILNDAYYYLNQCKGLPDIPSSEPLRQRNLRTCVLFSWIAVEEMLHYSSAELIHQKVLTAMPVGKLSARLTQVLGLKGAAPINIEDFRAIRQVRNSLAHPTSAAATEVSLTLTQTQKVFDYCLALIRILAPHELILEPFHSGPPLPIRGTRETGTADSKAWGT
jgi:hypothetical protein